MNFANIQERWRQPFGYKDVLLVALPLVVSMGSTTLMEFTDRVFLSRYSLDAIAASTPATLAHLVLLLFCIGTVGYSNVFIAQYYGAGRHEKVGAVLWQSIYLSLVGAFLLGLAYFIAEPLFSLVGHSKNIISLEVVYFRILTVGSGFALMASALSCFFSGRGITRPIMIVNTLAVLINIPLDYALIFGIGPFPALGIAGAGIATVSAWIMQTLMFAYLVFTRKNDSNFAVFRKKYDQKIFKSLTRLGLPAGVNMFFELLAFTYFIFVVGTIGEIELAASNIVFTINSIFFVPLMGIGIAVSTLVGQAIGRGNHHEAMRATTNTFHLAMLWAVLLGSFFIFIPELFINIFEPTGEGASHFNEIRDLGKVLLRFVVIYIIFDTVFIIYSGAVKGAGDTKFIMWGMGVMGLFCLAIPLYLVVYTFQLGLWWAWVVITAYLFSLGSMAFWRYQKGAWKKMSVVDKENE
ncbi:MAG: MATE family efflux transporter [Desulfotalea sp.]